MDDEVLGEYSCDPMAGRLIPVYRLMYSPSMLLHAAKNGTHSVDYAAFVDRMMEVNPDLVEHSMRTEGWEFDLVVYFMLPRILEHLDNVRSRERLPKHHFNASAGWDGEKPAFKFFFGANDTEQAKRWIRAKFPNAKLEVCGHQVVVTLKTRKADRVLSYSSGDSRRRVPRFSTPELVKAARVWNELVRHKEDHLEVRPDGLRTDGSICEGTSDRNCFPYHRRVRNPVDQCVFWYKVHDASSGWRRRGDMECLFCGKESRQPRDYWARVQGSSGLGLIAGPP